MDVTDPSPVPAPSTTTVSRAAGSGSAPDSLIARLDPAIASATARLRELQDGAGWWQGELETNVTMDAEDLLLREFLGIRTAETTAATARWIRSKQRTDGTWATFLGGPGDLSTTVEAYTALRLAGDPIDAPHMARAREFILARGGIEATRVFTRLWLALFGQWPWRDIPAIPPEVVLLPAWFPFNVYDFGCWARQTIVPLAIVRTLRPIRSFGFDLAELRTGRPRPPEPPLSTRAGWLSRMDKALKVYDRMPLRRMRRNAMRLAAEWIIARQEADGCWGGIQPPWVYSLIALHLLGYSLNHPVLRAGIAGLERFTVREDTPDGPVRRLEACQSPVWDTALAVIAMRDAEVPADDPALVRAAEWLATEEIRVPGDWTVRRPGVAPSGWAFEFDNDIYPDTDDTAEVLLALMRTGSGGSGSGSGGSGSGGSGSGGGEREAAIDRGFEWLRAMVSRDGGWGAFDADNTRDLVRDLPFCDFGEVIDPPSADVTAHVVEALCARGMSDSPEVRRGVDWLLANQESGGSWFGRWGANHVYGTGAVVPALVAAGTPADAEPIRRAVDWLVSHQNEDGGWGEDLRSYVDPEWVGRGTSTASQTAWALLALHAVGQAGSVSARRGVRWLLDTQLDDGGWDEPEFTGTGFPGDFYINYHLYRMVFPLGALGRIRAALREERG